MTPTLMTWTHVLTRVAAGIGLVAATASSAGAQTTPATASKPISTEPTITIEGFSRFEGRGNADFTARDPDENAQRFRLNAAWATRPNVSTFLQTQFASRRVSGVGPANTTDDDLVLHQGYIDASRPTLGRLRLGRQEMLFGDQRLIGNGAWSPFARSFDEARFTHTLRANRGTLDLFAGKLGHTGGKTQNPTFAGVYATLARSRTDAADLYLLYKGDNVTGRSQDILTVGTRPRLAFGNGFDASVEAAYQFGHVAARDVSAHAYAAMLGYSLPGPTGIRFAIERDFATGSSDPTGAGALHTFDQLFPTNHFHYGTMDLVGWRNMEAWKAQLRARPSTRLTVLLDAYQVRLANARDFWYADNGRPVRGGANNQPLRDPTGAAGKDLGTELDLTLTYVQNQHLTFSGGISRFTPGGFVRATNAGQDEPSHWLHFQTNFAF